MKKGQSVALGSSAPTKENDNSYDQMSLGYLPRRRRFLKWDRNQILWAAALAVLAIFVLAPIVPTIVQAVRDRAIYDSGGLFTLENFVRLFTEADFGRAIIDTLLFAIMTVIFTLLLAVPLAVIVVRTRLLGKRVFESVLQWPFYVSSLILGLGWIMIYGPAGYISQLVQRSIGFVPWDVYTLPGMAVAEAVSLTPIAYMFCRNALLQADPSLEHAARTSGARPVRIIMKVIIPMLRPAVVYSAVLVFSIAIETLSVPLIFGTPARITVFSTFLYRNGLQSINPDYGILGAASVIILGVAALLVLIQARLLKNAQRFITVKGKSSRPAELDLGRWKWVAFAFVTLFTVLGAFLPLAGVVVRSFVFVLTPLANPLDTLTFEHYITIFSFPAYSGSIGNSLIVAGIGAVVITLFAVVIALVAKRSPFRFRKAIDYLAQTPQAMPGIIVGIGLFWAFAMLPFGWGSFVQGTILALIIGFGFRALPAAFGSIAPSVMQLGAELDKAANTTGADWLRTMVRIILRVLLPSIAVAFLLTFITMFKEYAPAIFLGSADTKVIGTTMLELWAQGITGPVAALASIQIIVVSIVSFVAARFMKGHRNA